jgi:hypothetical protein
MGYDLMTNAVDTPWVELTISVPPDTTLESATLSIRNGEVRASPITVGSINVDLCTFTTPEVIANFSTVIEFEGLIAYSRVTLCSPGNVKLLNSFQAGASVDISLESLRGSAAFSSNYYIGSYELTSNTTSPTVTGLACISSESTATYNAGSCGGASTHKTTVKGATQVSLDAPGCPAGFTGDAPMGDNIPSSPTVNPTTSTTTTMNSNSTWWAASVWGFQNSIARNATSGVGVDFNVSAWLPQDSMVYWLLGQQDLTFRSGLASDLKFTIVPPATAVQGGAPGAIANITVLIVEKHSTADWGYYWKIDRDDFQESDPRVLYRKTYTGPWAIGSAGLTVDPLSIVLPGDKETIIGRLWFRVEWTVRGPVWPLRLRNVQLTTPIPAPASFINAGESERVSTFRMPSTLDPNPRAVADCPHRASGLSHWHDPSIWPGGVMPNPSQTITIPAGMSVLISSCSLLPTSYVYYKIVVPPTSKLIFGDANINMRVRNIHVQGQLHMGSPTCRLNGKINIEFVGQKTLADNIAAGLGSKGIGVSRGGSIDVHGRQFNPTWTRLAATVYPGADTIYLQDSTNWEVGQSIVIATSIYKDYTQDQNEVRVIKAIGSGSGGAKSVLQLDRPLDFYHYGGAEYQTEVGLLSRRIVFQGDAQSDQESFGGHTRVVGEGRFSGVQTRRMGQLIVLGKYPFHFHAMGPSPTSFIRDCSIWDSYFRCIAIHATNDSQALRNVVYNATAHCYYLEDGVEEGNVLNYNLAVKINTIGTPMAGQSQIGDETVSGPNLILPADSAAAGFYITNANNTFIGNAASGGWAGFSFPNLPKPIGISRDWDMIPQERPTLIFNGNTAHSSGYHFQGGGCIYIGGLLWYDSVNTDVLRYNNGRYSRPTKIKRNGAAAFMTFNNTKTWMCGMGVSHWGERIEVVGLESHDVGRPTQLFGEAWLHDALINTQSASLAPFQKNQMGFQFYDTYVQTVVSKTLFRNFKASVPPYHPSQDTQALPYYWPDQRVITSLIHSDYFKPQGISATIDISFDNCDRSQFVGHKRLETGAARYFNFVDWDGSFGGTTGVPQIIGSGSGWWKYSSSCVYESDWLAWRCPQGDRVIANLDYVIPGTIVLSGGDLGTSPSLYVGQTYLFGTPGIVAGQNATLTKNSGITGVSEIGWYFHTDAGTPATFSVYQSVMPFGHWVMGAWKYASGTTFDIKIKMDWGRPTVTVTQAASFSEVLSGDGTKYYFDGNHLYIKMINNQADYAKRGFTRAGATIYDVMKAVHYDVIATCANVNGNWCPSSLVHPTQTWT